MPLKAYHSPRPDLDFIAELIAPDSSVLDLGCGAGELLQKLLKEKNVQGHGVEIFDQFIYSCIEKGVPVIQADLDEGLDDYPNKSFDYVVLSRTLQVVHKPHIILKEMLRVGKTCIISVPNFGYWRIRLQLLLRGRMPVSKALPYEWYDTPNIHLSTVLDIQKYCAAENITIKGQTYLIKNGRGGLLVRLFPNIFSELAIFVIERNHLVSI
ncbi:methionine biosynthesis protein MetW [candidate division KSB1 bacterium]|nr:methionine biosynthesis protein MetW [candidate division KSB1 bacterium]